MTRSYHVQAYSHRTVVALPWGNLEQVLAFAREHGVRYLVAESAVIRARRFQLVKPLLGKDVPPGLTMVKEFTVGGKVRIFRLDPAPKKSTLPPIPLGYAGD